MSPHTTKLVNDIGRSIKTWHRISFSNGCLATLNVGFFLSNCIRAYAGIDDRWWLSFINLAATIFIGYLGYQAHQRGVQFKRIRRSLMLMDCAATQEEAAFYLAQSLHGLERLK